MPKNKIKSKIENGNITFDINIDVSLQPSEIRTKINLEDPKVEKEIQNILNNEITTDNGWGKREHWDNFEALFKSKFNEKMNKDWEMQRTIKDTIEKRLDNLFKEKTKKITEKIQDMVLDELLKEEIENGSEK